MQDCQISLEMLWPIQSSKFMTQIHIILRNLFHWWMQFSVQKLQSGVWQYMCAWHLLSNTTIFIGYIGSLQQLHVSALSLGHHQVVLTKP